MRLPGDEFHVFDTPHGKVGLGMCSEVYVPEVSRALALRGAEIIFLPAGCDKQRLWATWRTLIWARAIENLALVATTQNLFTPAERGLALVAGPEEILFESTQPGLSVVDVDLERLRWLRNARDGVGMSSQCAVKPGLIGPQWQRPELHDVIRPRRLLDAAEQGASYGCHSATDVEPPTLMRATLSATFTEWWKTANQIQTRPVRGYQDDGFQR